MKTIQPLAWWISILLGSFITAAHGEETAIVKENHINVRGQASLKGEVITQLQKGEQVAVLEEIPVPKPKKDEPAKWARIRMPANTPVWVYASYIDSANKTVKISRVNLRAGPGENYSVVGRLEKGDTVKDIRKVDEWMEIETPTTAYAFVAAEFLTKLPPLSPPVAEVKPAESPKVPSASKAQPDLDTTKTPPPTVVKTEAAEKPPVAAVDALPPAPKPEANSPLPATESPKPPVAETPSEKPAVAPPPVKLPTEVTVPTPIESGPPPKRIVRREGIVRSTKSIQAPTDFELINPETKKVIDYLHTEEPTLKLKDFKGKKVIVTGEEGLDARWPNTPLIEIQTLDLAP